MWNLLGFKDNPFDVHPLKVSAKDSELLVGRETEAIEFATGIESGHKGIYVLSGSPGVGKTSFFNVQQHRFETEGTLSGDKYLAARVLCPIQPDDNSRKISERIVNSVLNSILQYCTEHRKRVPRGVRKISRWLKNKNPNGFDFGLSLFGFGGNFGSTLNLPRLSEASFENIQESIEYLVSDVSKKLKFSGIFVALDNVENIDDQQLGDLLISLRDTLFSIDNVWWILIGQSGLGTLIQTLDSRVYDRITGSGLELKPISLESLLTAIGLRIERYHEAEKKTVLLPEVVYKHLYTASNGELRFTFKYCSSILIKIITWARTSLAEQGRALNEEAILSVIGGMLIDGEFSPFEIEAFLQEIIRGELSNLALRPKDKKIISYLKANGSVRPKEYEAVGFKNINDFLQNYLKVLLSKDLLIREQAGREVRYRLRGLSFLAAEYELL